MHVHAKHSKQRGRTHGAGCVRQWFRTAEPLGEHRYENWNTHTRARYRSSCFASDIKRRRTELGTCQIELLGMKGILILSLIAETQIGLCTYAMQLRFPVLNVDLWILRINVNQKK